MGPPQTKLAQGDYVESKGILVPRRFRSFEEGLGANKAFLMRSECLQDFAGASGILESPLVYPEELDGFAGDVDAFKTSLLRTAGKRQANAVEEYCRLMNTTVERFLAEVFYSYWEKLDGWNHSIVADTAVRGRYHVFTSRKVTQRNYSIFDDQAVVASHGLDEEKQAITTIIPSLIEWYDRVRHLERFDPNHCPVVEAQTYKGEHYFLQYHLTRDFDPTTFTLDRTPKDDEIESVFVRGATPPEGLTVQTAFYYPEEGPLLESEEGALDLPINFVFSELMARRRKVCFIKHTPMDGLASETRPQHTLLSSLFKPQVSTIFGDGFHSHLTEALMDRMFCETQQNGLAARVPFKITSDGRRALVKFIG